MAKESIPISSIIAGISRKSVLDVGAGGCDGENTSDLLYEYFESYTGITIDAKRALELTGKYPKGEIILDNFYNHDFGDRKFELVALDLTIESNLLRDWNSSGLQRVRKLIKDGGFLLNYVMMTDQYGEEDTPDLIRWHSKRFWDAPSPTREDVIRKLEKLPGFKLVTIQQEQRREYIYWVLLQKSE